MIKKFKHILSFWLFPPGITRILSKTLAILGSKNDKDEDSSERNSLVKIGIELYKSYGREYCFTELPVDLLRYQGGISYSSTQHHFVRYLLQGELSLKKYYELHQPKNIFEKHFIYSSNYSYSDNKPNFFVDVPWEVPKYNKTNLIKYFNSAPEGGLLIAEHGSQALGPVSTKKLKSEIRRLDQTLNSIQKIGYKPGQFEGHIRGYFLVNDEDSTCPEVFLVTGGQHRAAVLSFLEVREIPVQFEGSFPRCIKLSDLSKWPQVADGKFTYDAARLIFLSYFRNKTETLLKYW